MDNLLLEKLKKDVETGAKELLKEKVSKVVLYGSFARGDFDPESDVDFALLSNIPEKDISFFNESIGELTSELSIKYGILVSIIIISTDTFAAYKNIIPFYMNMVKEGVVVYG
jgi:predicted nucleotidyltransferase